jgi:hypothetical protein
MKPEKYMHFQIKYPFVWVEFTYIDEDGYQESMGWRPGTVFEEDGREGCDSVAHGMGWQLVTVVSVHNPGRPFPVRVFYTVKWMTPDGKKFGKNKLHITTLDAFRRRLKGFRHQFELRPREVEA